MVGDHGRHLLKTGRDSALADHPETSWEVFKPSESGCLLRAAVINTWLLHAVFVLAVRNL